MEDVVPEPKRLQIMLPHSATQGMSLPGTPPRFGMPERAKSRGYRRISDQGRRRHKRPHCRSSSLPPRVSGGSRGPPPRYSAACLYTRRRWPSSGRPAEQASSTCSTASSTRASRSTVGARPPRRHRPHSPRRGAVKLSPELYQTLMRRFTLPSRRARRVRTA